MVKFIETKFRKKINVSEQNNIMDDFFCYPLARFYTFSVLVSLYYYYYNYQNLGMGVLKTWDTKITGVIQGLMIGAFFYKGRLGGVKSWGGVRTEAFL